MMMTTKQVLLRIILYTSAIMLYACATLYDIPLLIVFGILLLGIESRMVHGPTDWQQRFGTKEGIGCFGGMLLLLFSVFAVEYWNVPEPPPSVTILIFVILWILGISLIVRAWRKKA